MFSLVALAGRIYGIRLPECLPLISLVDSARMTLGIGLFEPPPVLSPVLARSHKNGARGRAQEESRA